MKVLTFKGGLKQSLLDSKFESTWQHLMRDAQSVAIKAF